MYFYFKKHTFCLVYVSFLFLFLQYTLSNKIINLSLFDKPINLFFIGYYEFTRINKLKVPTTLERIFIFLYPDYLILIT